jgi:hypothetical protein
MTRRASFDLQRAPNGQLCGYGPPHIKPETVQYLLERGADTNWVAPNGILVLEHALLKYWSGDSVDVLAARAVHSGSLRRWATSRVCAASSTGMADRRKQRGASVRNSPPSVRPAAAASGSDDEETLLEALFVAMLNGRIAVLDYMIAQSTPVNSLLHESPVIDFAIANRMTSVVECLMRGGADRGIKPSRPHTSPRELAHERFEGAPDKPTPDALSNCAGWIPTQSSPRVTRVPRHRPLYIRTSRKQSSSRATTPSSRPIGHSRREPAVWSAPQPRGWSHGLHAIQWYRSRSVPARATRAYVCRR